MGARQLVVQEALETKVMSLVYLSRLTPQTNMGGVILGGSAHDDVLGAGVDVALAELLGQVFAGALADVLSTNGSQGMSLTSIEVKTGYFLPLTIRPPS